MKKLLLIVALSFLTSHAFGACSNPGTFSAFSGSTTSITIPARTGCQIVITYVEFTGFTSGTAAAPGGKVAITPNTTCALPSSYSMAVSTYSSLETKDKWQTGGNFVLPLPSGTGACLQYIKQTGADDWVSQAMFMSGVYQ